MIVKIYEGDNAFYAKTDGVPIGQTLKHGETCNVLKVTPINEVIPFSEVDLFRQRSLCYIDTESKSLSDLEVSKEWNDKFKNDYPNTLLAIKEKSGIIKLLEDGKIREVLPEDFMKQLKTALGKGYKGIAQIERGEITKQQKEISDKQPKPTDNTLKAEVTKKEGDVATPVSEVEQNGIVNNTQLYKGAKKIYKLIRPNCNYGLNKFVK